MTNRKEKLLALKEELSLRIEKIDKDLHNRKTSSKFSDQVVDRQNDDVLLNLKSEAEEELEQIDHALLKIEKDHYGSCEKCHEDITDERLDALPFATLCTKCAV